MMIGGAWAGMAVAGPVGGAIETGIAATEGSALTGAGVAATAAKIQAYQYEIRLVQEAVKNGGLTKIQGAAIIRQLMKELSNILGNN
jgi:hypothetical protein